MKKTFLLISAFAATTTLLAQDDLVIYGDVTPDIVWNNFAVLPMYRRLIIRVRTL